MKIGVLDKPLAYLPRSKGKMFKQISAKRGVFVFVVLIRTVVLYLFIVVGIRLLGKHQIGELEPSELVLTLIIADLASVPMQDNGIPLLSGWRNCAYRAIPISAPSNSPCWRPTASCPSFPMHRKSPPPPLRWVYPPRKQGFPSCWSATDVCWSTI